MKSTDAFISKANNLFASFHPLNGAMEVTCRCNARCDFCYIKQEKPHEDLSLDKIKYIIDKLYSAGVLFLCITGGEPFIRPDILSILSFCIKRDFFKISILTNGILINDDHIKMMGQYSDYFSFIRISVFSHISDVHDAYCGTHEALRTIILNAEKLRSFGIKVVFSLNIVESNCDTFEESMKFFENIGFKVQVGISKLINSRDLQKKLNPLIQKDFFSRYLHAMSPSKAISHQNKLKSKIQDTQKMTELCAGLFSNIHVRSTGDLAPCSSFRKLAVGNIFDDKSIPEMLRDSKLYRHLRSMKKTDTPECNKCIYINFCKHCIGAIHTEFGDFEHVPDQFCNFNKALHELRYE